MTKMEELKLLNFKHDVRNPLCAAKNLIEGHLKVLEEINRNETVRQNQTATKQVLRRSAREINRVIETVRKLNQVASKPEKTLKQPAAIQRIKIQTVLEQIVQSLKAEHYLEHFLLVMFVPRDLPEIEASAIDLEEIFYNLIINAAQAIPQNGRLSIDASCDPQRSELMLSFRDTGDGISEEAMPYIFEPFFTSHTNEGGVGFGLYIVKQLAERNNGRIAVESETGKGSTFRLFFPITKN